MGPSVPLLLWLLGLFQRILLFRIVSSPCPLSLLRGSCPFIYGERVEAGCGGVKVCSRGRQGVESHGARSPAWWLSAMRGVSVAKFPHLPSVSVVMYLTGRPWVLNKIRFGNCLTNSSLMAGSFTITSPGASLVSWGPWLRSRQWTQVSGWSWPSESPGPCCSRSS